MSVADIAEVDSIYRRRDQLAALAAQQGVTPVLDIAELKGALWPDDEPVEEFLAARERWSDEGAQPRTTRRRK